MEPTNNKPTPGVSLPPRRRLSRRSRVLGAVAAVMVLAATGSLAWVLTRPAKDMPRPAAGGTPAALGSGSLGGSGRSGVTVGTAQAEKADMPVTLDALGTVTPQASVRVRPQVSGVLQKVLFSEGQMVRAGDLLATIEPRQFQLALQQAAGQRQRDEAQLSSARVTLSRFNTLLDQDSIARQEVDTQAALVKQLEGTVMIDRANEGVAKLNLGYSRITAPVSGRVGLRLVDVGNVVSSSDPNGLALITQLLPIDVVFSVPQDRAGDLQQSLMAMQQSSAAAAGNTLKVTVLDRTRAVTLGVGRLSSLDNQVDTTTGTVKAKARFANADLSLFPSQFVNVRVLLSTIENAVTIPVTALRYGDNGNFVYVVNTAARTVSLRPVKSGQAAVDKVVVTQGLQAGETIITEGADRLKDGASVVLPGDTPRGARRPSPPAGNTSAASGGASSEVLGGGGSAAPRPGRPQRREGGPSSAVDAAPAGTLAKTDAPAAKPASAP